MPASSRRDLLAALGVLVLFAVVMFHQVLLPGRLLFSTDDGIGAIAARKSVLPFGFLGWWDDTVLMGIPQLLNINLTNLLLWGLPVESFIDWIHAIDLVAMSFFLVLYLRNRGVSWPACGLGVLGAFWLGSNFTLTYAGHIGKFGLMVFASAYLWLSDRAVEKGSMRWALVAGGALGAMFLEQADVALFCALFLGLYTFVTLLLAHKRQVVAQARVLMPIVGVAVLVAFHALFTGYTSNVKGVASLEESPAQRWHFITQWSWPPEESIDFIAPGYMGWRSGEPAGPYWGRMGRSDGWEQTGQGFMNFKLENHYIGSIPVLLAVWALVAAARSGNRKALMWLWGGITLGALVLSFGKYTPLYHAVFALPGFGSIRNPNKFLHIFQLGLGVLAAFGFDDLLRRPQGAGRLRTIALATAGALLLACLANMTGAAGAVARLSGAWGAYASTIVANKTMALLHGAALAGALGAFAWRALRRPLPRALMWAPVLVVAADALFLARHYVTTMRSDEVKSNPVVEVLKAAGPSGRTALVDQRDFYNYWLTYLFPYHGIPTFNFTQMPRMPVDYQALLGAVGRDPLRLWQVAAVRKVIGPAPVLAQVVNDPRLQGAFGIAYGFDVVRATGGGYDVVPASDPRRGPHLVLQYLAGVPRFHLVSRWSTGPMEQGLERLRNSGASLADNVIVHAETAPEPQPPDGAPGSVEVVAYRPGRVELVTRAASPALLRVADRYLPDWKATVNGQEEPVVRCDYLMQGVFVARGESRVVLWYQPSRYSLAVMAAGLAVALLGAASLAVGRPRAG